MTEYFLGLIFGFAMGFFIGMAVFSDSAMIQAYERGYAVECLGKTGYYWECDK
jgi:hypothetical protein